MKKRCKTPLFYQIYTRNFSSSGDFNGIIKHLDYLKNLGVDFLYLLPINTIGKVGRKGRMGSPYSIKDYYEINKELGTLEDFKKLIKLTHAKNMKIMIDIVFNHTSRDSYIKKHHPSWMYKNEDGKMCNKVGDWSDVYDLDLSKKPLRKYLIGVIDYYCSLGVDGFRFDVCSFLPKEFYIELQKMLKAKYPNTVLLGEAIDYHFVTYVRRLGFNALSDAELYELGFNYLYQYDSFAYLKNYLETWEWYYLERYKAALMKENAANPAYFSKIRGLENHDQKRLSEYTEDHILMQNLVAFNCLLKGPMFIYNGLETKSNKRLDLFNKDEMDWTIDWEWFKFIQTVIEIKKSEKEETIISSELENDEGPYISYINYFEDGSKRYGIFNLTNNQYLAKVKNIPSGTYLNLLDGKTIEIKSDLLMIREPLYLELIEAN